MQEYTFNISSLYEIFNYIAIAVVAIYNLSTFREKRNILSYPSRVVRERVYPKSKNKLVQFFEKVEIELFIEIIVIAMLQYLTGTFLNPWYGKLVGTGANYFGLAFFSPIIVVLFCICVRIDPLKQLDLITPSYPLALVFVKIGCIFGECCRGMAWEDLLGKDIEGNFPSPLLEAFLAFIIYIFLRKYRKKAETGTLFPIYLILYSGTRFFAEFLRIEPNVIGNLKTYHIQCIIGVIIGLSLLPVVGLVRIGMQHSAGQKKKKSKARKKK